MSTTSAPRRTRTRKPAVPLPLDERVMEVLRKHVAVDPLSLLARLKDDPAGEVVDAATRMVISRRIRVDAKGRFTLPEVTS